MYSYTKFYPNSRHIADSLDPIKELLDEGVGDPQ